MSIVVCKNVCFFLVKKFNALFSMAQENILSIDSYFISCFGSFNSRINLEDSILPIPKDNLFLIITSFISLLKPNIFWLKVYIIS